VGYFEIAAK
jgi:hypothetical protein